MPFTVRTSRESAMPSRAIASRVPAAIRIGTMARKLCAPGATDTVNARLSLVSGGRAGALFARRLRLPGAERLGLRVRGDLEARALARLPRRAFLPGDPPDRRPLRRLRAARGRPRRRPVRDATGLRARRA